jgi:hypothetical protein
MNQGGKFFGKSYVYYFLILLVSIERNIQELHSSFREFGVKRENAIARGRRAQ